MGKDLPARCGGCNTTAISLKPHCKSPTCNWRRCPCGTLTAPGGNHITERPRGDA